MSLYFLIPGSDFQVWNEHAWEHFVSSMPAQADSPEWDGFLSRQESVERGQAPQQKISDADVLEPKPVKVTEVFKKAQKNACHVPGCGKTYVRKSDLKIHIEEVHGLEELRNRTDLKDKYSQQKKFPCSHSGCPASCARHSDLLRHLRTVHNEEPLLKKGRVYICPVEDCRSPFKKKTGLNRHIAKTHPWD